MNRLDLKKNMDIIVGFAIMAIILMIIIPLPTFMLDVMLALNIGLSVLILLLTLMSKNVLELSIFPSILLVTTLFRLGLNISSTRLILSEGYAGNVIEAFGSFVVGGNYVVGIIIFLIIVLVQFIVITNGSSRVSEVNARFTLDALPGKQMSIDAELNAGAIDEKTAKRKRRELQQESDFYGAMDGASKFVKGDAIAGIVVTLINIIGGILIGVLMLKMTLGESVQTYIRLTIGDGLVSQIPALLISTSAGLLVTKADTEDSFADTLTSQLTSTPKALMMTGVVLLVLGLVPGLPKMSFFVLAITCILIGRIIKTDEKEEGIEVNENIEEYPVAPPLSTIEEISSLINIEAIQVDIGYGLIPLADESKGGDLSQRITSTRRRCATEMGLVLQPIKLKDDLQLEPNQYTIKIKGITVATYSLMPSMLLCMNPEGDDILIDGIKTIEPSYGVEAKWISKDKMEEAELYGYTVIDPSSIIITHLMEVIRLKSHELLGREEVKIMIDATKEKYPVVIEELLPDIMTIGEVQKVFQNLLKEGVPIKDRVTIFETLADNARIQKDIEFLTECVRTSLGRSICESIVDENNMISVVTLSKDLELYLESTLKKSPRGLYPDVDPEITTKLYTKIQALLHKYDYVEDKCIFMVSSPNIRSSFRKLIELLFPRVMVLSLTEIPNDVKIKAKDVLSLED